MKKRLFGREVYMADSGSANRILTIDEADRLISAHDGDLALLLIHTRRNGGFDAEKAARDLCRTLGEIRAAEEKLLRLGLLGADKPPSEPKEEKLPPEDSLPEYTTNDIVLGTAANPAFSAVVGEAARVFGHALSAPDTKKLYGIFDYLALPPEVILLLLNHCAEKSEGHRLSMRSVEKEAFYWFNREITTYERAEEHIAYCRARRDAAGRLCEVLGIRGRTLTSAERGYIDGWLNTGMAEDAIAEAFERTILNTGKLSWGYMNKIILSWHEAGIHTLSEVENKDLRRTAQPKPAAKPQTAEKIDLDELKRALDN